MCIPRYNQSLQESMMHVQVMPGSKKDWGPFLLTAWRYNLTDNVKGQIYLDYRQKLGFAEGFGANYNTLKFGKGDFKYYYTQERVEHVFPGEPNRQGLFQRYLIRLRHNWDIDSRTNFVGEYYKIVDAKRMVLGTTYNILKDYFPREYDKDALPLSYGLLHHNFTQSSIDMLLQKRTNRWYTQLEKLPEIKYSLPNIRIAETPFYFENFSQGASFNYKNAVPSSSTNDIGVNRLDTTNKVSLPMRIAFFNVTPFLKEEQTYYDKDINGSSTVLRNIFYSGADVSTKFYRIFNVKNNFLGMNINGLRHIITPTVGYAFNHEPTVLSSKLKQIDSIDAITRSNLATLELSNKLQTKRKGVTVDMFNFRVDTSYTFKPKTGDKRGSSFSDFLFNLELLPYSWMSIYADATLKHSGSRSDSGYGKFSTANYDISFGTSPDRSFGVGQRYQRKGSNEITNSFNWRFNPKWKFSLYVRSDMGHDPTITHGVREQEYTISRDMHCWIVDFTYNIKRPEGHTIWLIFRMKAFPEMEFGFNQSYHRPKPGSQATQ